MSEENRIDPPVVVSPPLRQSLPRTLLRLAIVVVVALVLREAYGWFEDQAKTLDVVSQTRAMRLLVMVGVVIYALLIAVPFVPAIEIGLALLVMDGAAIAPFVYVATVSGLLVAFGVGQRVSLDWLHNIFRDMHMLRACKMLRRIKLLPPQDRLRDLEARLPVWIAPVAIRYRYVTIAALLNIPGNFAVGGGGGIMMVAGISRFFATAKMVLTILLAVAPVPLAVWLLGADFLT